MRSPSLRSSRAQLSTSNSPNRNRTGDDGGVPMIDPGCIDGQRDHLVQSFLQTNCLAMGHANYAVHPQFTCNRGTIASRNPSIPPLVVWLWGTSWSATEPSLCVSVLCW